jgi:hypothetical protein
MKSIKVTTLLMSALLALLLGPLTANVALADHGHFHGHGGYWGPRFGVGFGVGVALSPWSYPYGYSPYGYYPYGYYPYAAYPPVVVTQPAAPTVYIEQGSPAPDNRQQSTSTPGQSNDWYYCHKPAGYYPYVQTCPEGWQRVPSQPQKQN